VKEGKCVKCECEETRVGRVKGGSEGQGANVEVRRRGDKIKRKKVKDKTRRRMKNGESNDPEVREGTLDVLVLWS